MKVDVLVAEIGSTTTVVNAFKDLDTDNPVFWAQGQAPTSVLDGDVRIGLQGAIDDLCRKMNIDSLEYDEMLATSSAAGGLKMTVHGLVYDMTAKAAKEAAKAEKERKAEERRARADELREERAARARKNDSVLGRVQNTAISTVTREVTKTLTRGIMGIFKKN